MKFAKALTAALAVLVASVALAAGPGPNVLPPKTPLRYIPCTYTFSTTTNVTAAQVCVLPPGGAVLKDVVVYQNAAGTGGTSWVVTPKRAAVALTSTDGGFTLAAGASKVTNTAGSPLGALTNPSGGTRPVIKGNVASTGTVTVAAALGAGETAVINGVTFTSVASGATGNQWNATGTAATDGPALAAAINNSTSAAVKGAVTASAVNGVVTITARTPGVAGNAITTTVSGAHMSAGGATLTGGFDAISSPGGEIVTADVTLTGVYSVAVSGVVTLWFEPRN